MRILIISLIVFFTVACESQQRITLSSPNGELELHVTQEPDSIVRYSVNQSGSQLIEPSELGLVVNGKDLHRGMTLVDAGKRRRYSDAYSMTHGKKSTITYTANEQLLIFENRDDETLGLRFRVSDQGIAFRYELPARPSAAIRVEQELTSFALPGDARAYLQPMAVAQTGFGNTNPSYEEHYAIDVPVGTESPSPAGWVFPALFESRGKWLLISESNMAGDWHASRLQAKSEGGVYKLGAPMAAEVTTGGALLANGQPPMNSPWRLIAVGDLADIVDSTLGTDLAKPAGMSAEPFKPGFASWSWALLKDDSVNYETTREFIDYAAKMQWQYTLVDVEWDTRIGQERIRELADYAASKNVGLLLWYNSSGDWNTTEYTPKSKLVERNSRRKEFKKIRDWGIKGIKVDFFPGDGQSVMQYYIELLQDAAEYGLIVNFHGSSIPRGLARTYPNLMTMEAVKGFEYITFDQGNADRAAEHAAMLPFTRNVFDPMDFTPTTFGEIPNINRRTTNGFEAALPVLFLSGVQHIAETPANMNAQAEWLQDYMRNIPVLWDESRLLAGDPGKLAVIARRKGERWYIAGINGEAKAKRLNLDLSFVNELSGRIISDKAPRELELKRVTATANTPVTLLPEGGFVMIFEGKAQAE